MQIATNRLTLNYTCPDCGTKDTQPLSKIVEEGTFVCSCGADMDLDPEVTVLTEAATLPALVQSARQIRDAKGAGVSGRTEAA